MKIRIQDDTHPGMLVSELEQRIYHSRFTADVYQTNEGIKIDRVRLCESKPYCGSHPGTCQIQRAHKRANYLEGADWVEFNDLLNDVLDHLEVKARVESSVCVLRQGYERCVEYSMRSGFGPNAEWEKYGTYEDWCGQKAPASQFPEGTPGMYAAIGYHAD